MQHQHTVTPNTSSVVVNFREAFDGQSIGAAKKVLKAYTTAFDAARPNTAESVQEYLDYIKDTKFNIFAAQSVSGYQAATHVRIGLDVAGHQTGTIENIWHGSNTEDLAYAVKTTLAAIAWLKQNGCERFVMERVNPHTLASTSEVEGSRYAPGEEADIEAINDAQLETRSLAQETEVLKVLNSDYGISSARLVLPYFQPDIWGNGFSHGYFGLWIGSCNPNDSKPLKFDGGTLLFYMHDLYGRDEFSDDSLSARAIEESVGISYHDIKTIPIEAESDEIPYDRPLQSLREQFLSGELSQDDYERDVIEAIRKIREAN